MVRIGGWRKGQKKEKGEGWRGRVKRVGERRGVRWGKIEAECEKRKPKERASERWGGGGGSAVVGKP